MIREATEVHPPLPLAGEGWGGGASARRAGRVDRFPPPAALWRAIALPSASTSPASGRGEVNPPTDRFNQRPCGSTQSNAFAHSNGCQPVSRSTSASSPDARPTAQQPIAGGGPCLAADGSNSNSSA